MSEANILTQLEEMQQNALQVIAAVEDEAALQVAHGPPGPQRPGHAGIQQPAQGRQSAAPAGRAACQPG